MINVVILVYKKLMYIGNAFYILFNIKLRDWLYSFDFYVLRLNENLDFRQITLLKNAQKDSDSGTLISEFSKYCFDKSA